MCRSGDSLTPCMDVLITNNLYRRVQQEEADADGHQRHQLPAPKEAVHPHELHRVRGGAEQHRHAQSGEPVAKYL